MIKPIVISVFIAALVGLQSVSAAPVFSQVARETRLLAGPWPELPVVAELRAGTEISVQGCLDDLSWCDVVADQAQGWLDAGDIAGQHQGMGIGTVEFDLLTYWAQHYTDQPWYDQRERWAHHPRVNRQHWPQFPGQPPIHPQPPPPPPPPKTPGQPLSPGQPRS